MSRRVAATGQEHHPVDTKKAMRSPLVLIMILVAFGLMQCQEFERQTLLNTMPGVQSDTLIRVIGNLSDLADGETIVSYGHCWSDIGTPTIENTKSIFSGSAITDGRKFETTVDDFFANRTYFFRTYATLASGETRYGNMISVNTGATRGRWERSVDFFSSSRVIREDDSGCGLYYADVRKMGMFMNACFYQDNVIAGNGYAMQGMLYMDYVEDACDDVTFDEYRMRYGLLEYRTPYLKTFGPAEQWELATHIDNFLVGFGGVAVVDGNLLYTGASNVDYATGLGYTFFDPYSSFEGNILSSSGEFRVYDIQNNTWHNLRPRRKAVNFYGSHFQVENKIYMVSGIDSAFNFSSEVWAYDIPSDTWARMEDFPAEGRIHSACFTAGGKAYVGGGFSDFAVETDGDLLIRYPQTAENDWYEYDPQIDSWKRVADFPGPARGGAFAFGIYDLGYVGTGASDPFGIYYKDFWKFDPRADKWEQLNDFPGNPRYGASGFSNATRGAAGFGYVVTNFTPNVHGLYEPTFESDLWFFNPLRN